MAQRERLVGLHLTSPKSLKPEVVQEAWRTRGDRCRKVSGSWPREIGASRNLVGFLVDQLVYLWLFWDGQWMSMALRFDRSPLCNHARQNAPRVCDNTTVEYGAIGYPQRDHRTSTGCFESHASAENTPVASGFTKRCLVVVANNRTATVRNYQKMAFLFQTNPCKMCKI